jgi:hypothetical protein
MIEKYIDQFKFAQVQTSALGFDCDFNITEGKKLLSPKLVTQLFDDLKRIYQIDGTRTDYSGLINSCFPASHMSSLILKELHNIGSCLTMGGYSYNGNAESYNLDFEQLTKLAKDSGLLKSHVWLTLESGEVFDPTVISSIKWIEHKKLYNTHEIINTMFNENINHKISYFPKVIGTEFLISAGIFNLEADEFFRSRLPRAL